MLVEVDNNHIRRMKNHIIEFFAEPTIGVIIGTNGYIWIEACRRENQTFAITEIERY